MTTKLFNNCYLKKLQHAVCGITCQAAPERLLLVVLQDAVSMTAADELSSSVSEDTGFCSAPPLPADPPELCDLTDSQDPPDSQDTQDPHETQDPQEELDPAPPPPPAIDAPPGFLCEEEAQTVLSLSLDLPPETKPDPDPDPDSTCGSVWEEDVTQALKELDERCEEEEADFSGMSR